MREFLELVKPRIAFISCGRNNTYGHPHAELLDRLGAAGARIYRTDRGGCLTLTITGGRVKTTSYLDTGE